MTQELIPTQPQQIHAVPMEDEFRPSRFWRKLRRAALKLSRTGLEHALTLYYAAQRAETPSWAKATIYAALAYFVLPLDSIPDITPGVGYSDDLLVLAAAVSTIAAYINDEVRQQAAAAVERIFGSES